MTYQKQKNYYKGPLFSYECINQGVKHWLFLGKYRLKVVKVKDYKIKEGGSITFQNRHKGNCECLNIANLVNTKVSKFSKLSIYNI